MLLTDEEIQRLLESPKTVANPRARQKSQRGHDKVNYELDGQSGERFRLYVRQNGRIEESFSCGLQYLPPGGESITLARYNGSDHPHNNPLEMAEVSMVFHIHRATERYMAAGMKPEHFAEATDRFKDLRGALKCIVSDCKITGMLGLDDPTPPPPGPDHPQFRLL